MTTKKGRRTAGTKNVNGGQDEGLVGSAVAATIELGHAAESFQDSLSHVQNARSKGRAITKRVGRAVSSATKKVTSAAKSITNRSKKKTTATKKTKRSRTH